MLSQLLRRFSRSGPSRFSKARRSLRTYAFPIITALIILAPPLMVWLTGRNLSNTQVMFEVIELNVWSVLIGRLTTLGTLGLSVLLVVDQLTTGKQGSGSRGSRNNGNLRLLYLGIIAIYLGTILLPSMLGAIPLFERNHHYGLFLLCAAVIAGAYQPQLTFQVARTGLFIFMASSLIFQVVSPEMTSVLSADRLEGFVDFRLWGLGSGPNSLGPAGLLLIMLVLHQPYKHTVVNILAIVAGAACVLLAQSQTTWAAAMIVLPIQLLIRAMPKRSLRDVRMSPLAAAFALLCIGIGVSGLFWQLAQADWASLPIFSTDLTGRTTGVKSAFDIGDEIMTGRGKIWEIAYGLWQDNWWFGYGLTTWDEEFRQSYGMLFAFSAHNQFLQVASVGGFVGIVGATGFLAILVWLSYRTARRSDGLSVALLILLLIRTVSETPLDIHVTMTADFFCLLLLLFVLGTYLRIGRPRRREHRRTSGKSRRRRSSKSKTADATSSSGRRSRRRSSGSRQPGTA